MIYLFWLQLIGYEIVYTEAVGFLVKYKLRNKRGKTIEYTTTV